jgi:hypothetical protein
MIAPKMQLKTEGRGMGIFVGVSGDGVGGPDRFPAWALDLNPFRFALLARSIASKSPVLK